MSILSLSIYFLMWPAIVLGVMIVIGHAFFSDWKKAREAGEDII
ncbi:putative transporter small subunit [Nesterenkonia lutea]|uniref:Uncharacterized protein n=1 Tax=Nesterenkonia lutea TaxID=272919 RepID=A0ABR9JCP1_9MICC|nr:putative transporter small subunit [Nesterenkonia lutea]MBE1523703.1 hypothetical protein [Nesterenkonia lutea]